MKSALLLFWKKTRGLNHYRCSSPITSRLRPVQWYPPRFLSSSYSCWFGSTTLDQNRTGRTGNVISLMATWNRRRSITADVVTRLFSSSLSSKNPPQQQPSPSSSSVASKTSTSTTIVESAGRRRKRHRFDGTLDHIPSFQQFQQQQQVRSLYRQFLRLVYSIENDDGTTTTTNTTSTRQELLDQLRRQFRQNYDSSVMSSWDIKRALSEGSKRYKEVSAMLGSSAVSSRRRNRNRSSSSSAGHAAMTEQETDTDAAKAVPNATIWPWNQQQEQDATAIPKRPSPFPKKSGL